MTISGRGLASIFSVAVVLGAIASFAKADEANPIEPLVITRDTVLERGKTYGPIVIAASGITVDGNGATLLGPGKAGAPKSFQGTGIRAEGVDRVTLKNLQARGWETGLIVRRADAWTIEGCDFSDNFHDPEFGWGENGRRGGIVFDQVRKSTVRKCKANRVWDGCVLVSSDENRLESNDFSHTSNTCLKLWTSGRNTVEHNNLSYGIRIKPGEVHARDSTSVLIESGSHYNRFLDNDCTHGGDGIFVRVLNGWVSSFNYFEKNDCSYANNNGFECWAPDNEFVGNKANHCSYGFWMGGSDRSVLRNNEASFNGRPDGQHNSPHLPDRGHAGIVFMFGPSSHTVAHGNVCCDNNGAGIAIIGDQGSKGQKWKAFHWIVEQNRLERNRWGVFLEYADWIDLRGNAYRDNSVGDVHQAAGLTRVTGLDDRHPISADVEPPKLTLDGPHSVVAGQAATWTARLVGAAPDAPTTGRFQWDLGEGDRADSAQVAKTFSKPGFYRVGVTAFDGKLRSLAWRDLYVIEAGTELATEGGASSWSWGDEQRPPCKVAYRDDTKVFLAGKSSVAARVEPYNGSRVHLLYPRERNLDLPLAAGSQLVFWVKAQNPNLPGFQDVNPIVTLYGAPSQTRRLKPKRDLFSQPSYNEAREGWRRIVVPLDGDAEWEATADKLERVNAVSIGVDSWGGDPLDLWLDGLRIQPAP